MGWLICRDRLQRHPNRYSEYNLTLILVKLQNIFDFDLHIGRDSTLIGETASSGLFHISVMPFLILLRDMPLFQANFWSTRVRLALRDLLPRPTA
jgi:hypothetical protein